MNVEWPSQVIASFCIVEDDNRLLLTITTHRGSETPRKQPSSLGASVSRCVVFTGPGTMTSVTVAPLEFIKPREPKPEWLKVRAPGSENYLRLKGVMKELKLNTVCEDARCPNIGECWHHGTATFMILGDVCTRACAYCAVAHGRPNELDTAEPARVAEAIERMGLQYAVITSVDRDDLADGGASIFAETIRETRARVPSCRIGVLIPDFQGSAHALYTVLDAGPDVLNHNIETVPRLYRMARSGGKYA